MSDHSTPLIEDERVEEERRIARSGGLARVARACARHPWRVVGGWVVIIIALIGLNVAYHGTLINDFKVPGTDFQKATDLINAKFGGQKGAALRVVVAAPEGQRLDSPANQAVVDRMRARAEEGVRGIDEDPKRDIAPIASPLAKSTGQLSQDGRFAFFDAQFDRTSWELKRADIVKLENDLRAIGAGQNVQVEFTGEAEGEQPDSSGSE